MNISVALKSALRELKTNKMRSVLMIAGIVVGITVLTIVLAVGTGAQQRVQTIIKGVGIGDVIIVSSRPGAMGAQVGGGSAGVPPTTTTIRGQHQESALTIEDVEALRQINGVKTVSTIAMEREVNIKFGSHTYTTGLYGVEPGWEELTNQKIAHGSFFTERELEMAERVVVLGQTVANNLFTGGEDPLGQTIRIENTPFEVVGVFESRDLEGMTIRIRGMTSDDIAVIPGTTFHQRFSGDSVYSSILVQPTSVRNIGEISEKVRQVLRQARGLSADDDDNFGITIPAEAIGMRLGISDTMMIFLVVAGLISLGIGGVVIMNIMLVSVGERTREIGLRKALGARKKDILKQFLLEAVVVSLVGGIIGIISGAVGSALVEFFTGMPVVVSWSVILGGAFFAVLVGIVFGLKPAQRAAALNPVDALRSE